MDRWSESLDALVQWRAENQGVWPNSRSQDAIEALLGHWFRNQRMRTRRGVLSNEHILILNERLPGWNHEVDHWSERLQEMIVWRQENPGKWPNKRSTDELERKLGIWRQKQREYWNAQREGRSIRGSNALTQERIDRLNQHLPGWNEQTNEWSERLESLVQWRAQPGNQGVWPNSRSQDAIEARLGHWFRDQRMRTRRGVLTPDHILILNERLPGWNDEVDHWSERLQEMIEWRQENPGRWPRSISNVDKEVRLGRWRRTQRQYWNVLQQERNVPGSSNLTPERIDRLNQDLPGWNQ
jgi:hypothetical protein